MTIDVNALQELAETGRSAVGLAPRECGPNKTCIHTKPVGDPIV